MFTMNFHTAETVTSNLTMGRFSCFFCFSRHLFLPSFSKREGDRDRERGTPNRSSACHSPSASARPSCADGPQDGNPEPSHVISAVRTSHHCRITSWTLFGFLFFNSYSGSASRMIKAAGSYMVDCVVQDLDPVGRERNKHPQR